MSEDAESYLIEEGASTDTDMVEVDPETEALLTEAGIDFGVVETPPAEESEEIVESETEAPEPEHPVVEPEVEELPEEQPLILGKYKTRADLENAYREAERKIHEGGQVRQQAEQLQQVLDQIASDPEGQKTILRLSQPQRPQIPQVPREAEEFEPWAMQMTERAQAREQEIAQLRDGLNKVYAHLEGQAVTQKYGDTLNELQPYIEQVNQALGQRAAYRTQEEKILMAEALQGRDAKAVTATQQQTEQQQTEIKAKHREKAISASVESANNATDVAPKIVDPRKLSLEEHEKWLIDVMGAKIVSHDD